MKTFCCGSRYTSAHGIPCDDCPGAAPFLPTPLVPMPPPIFPAPPQRLGWICPRCNVVHSPDDRECHCGGPTFGPRSETIVFGAVTGGVAPFTGRAR